MPQNLTLKFLPPNVTSKHQPADMGIISTLKVGYMVSLLDQLLEFFILMVYSNVLKSVEHNKKDIGGLHIEGSFVY